MKAITNALAISVMTIAMGGCASYQNLQHQQQVQAELESRAAAATRAASMNSTCASYGFTVGTTEFANCMMQLDQADRERRIAIAGALLNADLARRQAKQTEQDVPLFIPSRPLPAPPVYRAPVTTNCTPMLGGGVNCTTQ